MQRFWAACLSAPPQFLLIGEGIIRDEKLEWAQATDKWTILYYLHGNVVTVNASTFAVKPDTIAIFAPSVKAGHARSGPGTLHRFITFDLPGDAPARYAVPTYVADMGRVLPDLVRAAERISDTKEPASAFVWNLLWSVARSPSVLRAHQELYGAEEFVLRHLNLKLTVPRIAAAVGLSERQLLRLFRKEHGTTVQEFVRRKRVQEAARLLVTTDLPIKVVAQRVGVSDPQQFNKLIRLDTGSSPTALRDLGQHRK